MECRECLTAEKIKLNFSLPTVLLCFVVACSLLPASSVCIKCQKCSDMFRYFQDKRAVPTCVGWCFGCFHEEKIVKQGIHLYNTDLHNKDCCVIVVTNYVNLLLCKS